MNNLSKLPALLKREILEHKNIWRVPLILIGIALLVKMSLMIGNLSIDIDVPDQLQLEGMIDSTLDTVIAKALNSMNYLIMLVMFVVAIFYALTCLYNERQDESVLFWRSLPISDSLTITSKLILALLIVPLIVVVCQAVVSILFFGTQSIEYLSSYYAGSLLMMVKTILWSLLPIIAWCIVCSATAKKNPFLLAFIAPIILVLVDKLFLNGIISQMFIINRVSGVSDYSTMPLITGILFSAVCIVLSVVKRSQRI